MRKRCHVMQLMMMMMIFFMTAPGGFGWEFPPPLWTVVPPRTLSAHHRQAPIISPVRRQMWAMALVLVPSPLGSPSRAMEATPSEGDIIDTSHQLSSYSSSSSPWATTTTVGAEPEDTVGRGEEELKLLYQAPTPDRPQIPLPSRSSSSSPLNDPLLLLQGLVYVKGVVAPGSPAATTFSGENEWVLVTVASVDRPKVIRAAAAFPARKLPVQFRLTTANLLLPRGHPDDDDDDDRGMARPDFMDPATVWQVRAVIRPTKPDRAALLTAGDPAGGWSSSSSMWQATALSKLLTLPSGPLRAPVSLGLEPPRRPN